MLRPCGRKDMVERVLRNLKAIHLRDEDKLRALRVVDLLVARSPARRGPARPRRALCRARLLRPRGERSRVLPGARPPGEGRRGARGARGAAQAQGLTAQLTEGRQFMTTVSTASGIDKIAEYLGGDARGLLDHACKGIPKSTLHLPGPDFVDRGLAAHRPATPVLRSLQALSTTAASRGTGYVSILPVDQGIEHSAGASFAPNPQVLRPREHREARHRGRLQRRRLDVRRARRGGAQVRAQDPVHREDQPQRVPDATRTSSTRSCSAACKQALRHGRGRRSARRSTSARAESRRQIVEVAQAFQEAHELGMVTILWCYMRNNAFKNDEATTTSPPTSPARPTTSASRSRPTSSSRSCPRTTAATRRSHQGEPYGKTDKRIYTELTTDHPIDLTPLPGRELLHGPRRPDQLAAARRRARATWPRPSRPPSSTSAPAAWG